VYASTLLIPRYRPLSQGNGLFFVVLALVKNIGLL